jgi:hypothetical protein
MNHWLSSINKQRPVSEAVTISSILKIQSTVKSVSVITKMPSFIRGSNIIKKTRVKTSRISRMYWKRKDVRRKKTRRKRKKWRGNRLETLWSEVAHQLWEGWKDLELCLKKELISLLMIGKAQWVRMTQTNLRRMNSREWSVIWPEADTLFTLMVTLNQLGIWYPSV